VDDVERERLRNFKALGFGACAACVRNPCGWAQTVDPRALALRRRQLADELADELHFVKMNAGVDKFDSAVPASAQRGGTTRFYRDDLIFELEYEDKILAR
jgi:hypothetical protein